MAASNSASAEWLKRLPSNEREQGPFRLYKRRWLGLVGLIALNLGISMSFIIFGSIAQNSADFFKVSLTAINWLSTLVCALFLAISPIVPYFAKHYGCRGCGYISGLTLIIGCWLRYAAAAAQKQHSDQPFYGLLITGQIMLGIAQPFANIVATLYSETFMSEQFRTTSTMLISVANPVGCAIAGILGPALVTNPSDLPKLLLVLSTISTCLGLTALMIPGNPPTPPSAPGSDSSGRAGILFALRQLLSFRTKPARELFYVFCIFSCLVVFEIVNLSEWRQNASTTFLSQIFEPVGYSNDESGFFGAASIAAGLVFALVAIPLLDNTRLSNHLRLIVRVLVVLVAIAYIGLIFAARPNATAGIYFLMIAIGICSFTLLPVSLEISAELSFAMNLSPESTSALLYLGGNGLSVVFLLAENALRDRKSGSMTRGLIFQAVLISAASALVFGVSAKQERKSATTDNDSTVNGSPLSDIASLPSFPDDRHVISPGLK